MLIKAPTTEQRIAEIASKFQEGIKGYQGGQQRQNEFLSAEAARREAAIEREKDRELQRESWGIKKENNAANEKLREIELGNALYKSNQLKLPFDQRDDFLQSQSLLKTKNANKPTILPIENKTTISTLAKKNSDATYIANNLDTFLKNSENYSDDQLLTQGKQLIKTINSTLGPDATGAEEVKRLASKLEFGLGNFTNDNPTQFGRDLKGFKQQVKDTVAIMRGSVDMNKQEIERQYGRSPNQKDSVNTQQAAPGKAPWEKYKK